MAVDVSRCHAVLSLFRLRRLLYLLGYLLGYLGLQDQVLLNFRDLIKIKCTNISDIVINIV